MAGYLGVLPSSDIGDVLNHSGSKGVTRLSYISPVTVPTSEEVDAIGVLAVLGCREGDRGWVIRA